MQKQPGIGGKYRIETAVRELDPGFPIRLGSTEVHEQNDRPITKLHRHNCLEIGYWIDGSGIFVAGDKIMPYQGGDLAVTTAGELHFGRSARGTISRSTWIFLDPEGLLLPVPAGREGHDPAGFGGHRFSNIISGERHPRIREMVLALIEELEAKPAGYRSCVRGLVLALLVRLQRLAGETSDRAAASLDEKRRSAALERVTPALGLMAASYSRPIYVEELAAACHASVTNFRRIFRRATSRPPIDYLAYLRVQMAMGLLENTDRRVHEICTEVGFETPSSFSRQFRRVTGESPKAWRLSRRG